MDLFLDGATLMVIGMATVFGFLVLLVVAMSASASFFSKYFKDVVVEAPVKVAAADPVAEIAVALAAIRAKRG